MAGMTPHDHLENWEFENEQLSVSESSVCRDCITDPALWALVSGAATEDVCAFCDTGAECVTFEDLGLVVEGVLRELYVTLEESGAYRDEGEWSETVHSIETVIGDELLLGAVDDSVFVPLLSYISGRDQDTDYGLVLRRDVLASMHDFDEGAWRNFMRDARAGRIRTGPAAVELLSHVQPEVLELLGRIERYALLEGLFKAASPTLWRCRPGEIVNRYWTGNTIGSASSVFASDGRLNAATQSVFYGSTTLRGAVIEMVNHHGAEARLWGGRFATTRPLYHLDLMDLPGLPSPFAPGAADTYDAINFLSRFAETLRERRPREIGRHYLPTQVFTAFLLAGNEDLRPDAIKFASSLDPSSENWVVFVDNEHCADAGEARLRPDELYMLLDPSSVTFVFADEFLGVSG